VNRALALLLWLRFRAWFRRILRNAGTVRGVIFLLVGVGFFVLIVGPPLALRLIGGGRGMGPGSPELYQPATEHTRFVGSLLLFAYGLLTVLFAPAEQGISFTPAEVQFLFAGPFSRRQLLAYKLTGNALLALLYGVFLSLLLLRYAANPAAAYLGLVVTLWFVQFFTTAVSLVLQTIGAEAFNRRRKLLLVGVIALVVLGVGRLGQDALAEGPGAVVARLEGNRVVQALLTPTRWFVETATAAELDLAFAAGMFRCLAIDAALLGVIFLLDARYLEAAAAASERVYARLQRVRSGGAIAAGSGAATARFGVAMLPWLGGAGPVAWRQLTTALRSLRPLLVFLGIFSFLVLTPRLAWSNEGANSEKAGWLLASIVLGMTFAILTPLLTFDFRGDIDRMDVLKALPISPAGLALGQMLAPVLLLSAVQVALVALAQLFWGGVEVLLVGVALFAVPLNFLSIGVENLLFLWFPTRQVPATPGDFQLLGRQMLVMFSKFLVLAVVIGPALLAAGIAYGVASLLGGNELVAAVATAWLILTGLSAGIVPLVAQAFRSFDVARDTPP
jgi:hypothetical protein